MRRQRGFTLLEILIAMGMFTVIGFAVTMLMKTAVDMWIRGNEGTQQIDRQEQSLPRLEEDLRMTLVPPQTRRIPFDPKNPDPEVEPEPLPPENRFLSGYVVFKLGERDVHCRYLSFVREITGMDEIEVYASRAGTNPQADAYIDGRDDEEEFKKNRHLPTGGAAEVLWIWLPDAKRPGVGAVYRAYRSPVGGPGTLLDPQNFDDLREVTEVIAPAPIFQDVVLFDLLFWTQYTTTWEYSKGDPRVVSRPKTPAEMQGGRPICGPSRTWDSTRGILKGGEAGFTLTKGPKSLRFTADDIWPRAVRIEFSLVEEQTTLATAFSASDREFVVDALGFASGYGELRRALMKIGEEWLLVDGRDPSRRDVFLVSDRGQRSTPTLSHAMGAPVYFGRVYDASIPIPSFRDDNN
jgi:prepilin-type N-terminal cleavage/methylation domain-containing protein